MSTALTTPTLVEAETEPSPRRWTRDEYYQMGELGLFRGQRAELIEGEIMVLSPQGAAHTYHTDRAYRLIDRSGWGGVWVRVQYPIDFGIHTEPEPDISVVAGVQEDYQVAHPKGALLVVEVSDSTLWYDRGRKARLYASLGVADYWIANVADRQLEVRRDPGPDPAQPGSFHYASVTILEAGGHVSPVHAPGIRIAVADLFP